MSLKSGQRVAWFDVQSKSYHYGNVLPTGVELSDDGLNVYIDDAVSRFVSKVPYDSLDLKVREKYDDTGDFITLDQWVEDIAANYFTDYDGSAYFTDGEYLYSIGNPFELHTKDKAEPYRHFKGVVFFGK